jgi:hypothetical protein
MSNVEIGFKQIFFYSPNIRSILLLSQVRILWQLQFRLVQVLVNTLPSQQMGIMLPFQALLYLGGVSRRSIKRIVEVGSSQPASSTATERLRLWQITKPLSILCQQRLRCLRCLRRVQDKLTVRRKKTQLLLLNAQK